MVFTEGEKFGPAFILEEQQINDLIDKVAELGALTRKNRIAEETRKQQEEAEAKVAIFGRIARDDASIISDLDRFTASQIDTFLKFALEKGSANCTAAFLNYKNEHFKEFAEIDEFTLDF